MNQPISQETLNQVFNEARSQNGWQEHPIQEEILYQLYDLTKMGPTSANCSPGRFVFVRTEEGKSRLAKALSKGNMQKTMTAPVTVIAAWDKEFYEQLPTLFPHGDARSWFTGSPAVAHETAFRNSSLQAAYFMLAARSLGLDVGPMSGFDKDILDEEFFVGTTWTTNFVINIGYGDPSKVFGRLPRLAFDAACKFA